MSSARQHIEWLSLVPVSGPFLSLPVLEKVFPQGLDSHSSETTGPLRLAYAEWRATFGKPGQEQAALYRWITFVLKETLQFEGALVEGQGISQTLHVEIPEHGEILRPTFALLDPANGTPRLLIQTYPRTQELTTYVANARWKASPDTRMTEQLHGAGVRLGLVTNGEHWMLVDAPKGETTGYASWYAGLWLEEPVTLKAFRSLLGADRFFGEPDKTLEAMLAESASNQQEVTERLGYQVLKAVEVLIQSLDRADQDYGRSLLSGVSEATLYESALTIMMRLVFLFCAEERELIPSKPFPVYEQNYSVSAISRQLRELADQHGEELLERRHDAWPRLLSAFRAVYGGLHHDDVHIPAYGGNLFNPDRFPFLEGRLPGTTWRETEASPLPVNNRTVLHLLEALQELEMKVPGGGKPEKRHLSFRALDIEQIGHVYEGLLDHTAKRATEPFLGLVGSGNKEPEISLAALENAAAKSADDLVKLIKEQTGRSETTIRKALTATLEPLVEARLTTACQSNPDLLARVRPFAGLVRRDSFEYPVVIPKGSVFVTAGTDRRSSGTHYTPRSLTEPIVQYTLEPLVYVGPAEGKPKAEWQLKSAKDLLALKICDMACGSGAFLVQTARYMAERLLEAWDEARAKNPDEPGITPEGEPSSGNANETLIPDDPDERKVYAMRIIAQRCLYGVDKNPLAVEMAKLSLWLLTLAKDKPFEFLDHSIRSGDSLVGIHDIEQLRHYQLKPDPLDPVLFKGPIDTAVDEAIALRLKLEDLPANTIEDVERQEKLLQEANDKIAKLKYAADLLVSAEFWGENAKDKLERGRFAADMSTQFINSDRNDDLVEFESLARRERRNQPMFHWLLEFPEVMVGRGGFDAFVGNPPYLGGTRISTALGNNYVNFLKTNFNEAGNRTDFVAYFFRKSFVILKDRGNFGFLTTNSISETDTANASLIPIIEDGGQVFWARKDYHWPGTAGVYVSQVIACKGDWDGNRSLNEFPAEYISGYLTDDVLFIEPKPLVFNCPAGNGAKPNAMGFLLSDLEALELIAHYPDEKSVVRRYLAGEDIARIPTLIPDRWAIYFGDVQLSQAEKFPTSMALVRERVYPERSKAKNKVKRDKWWQFERHAKEVLGAAERLTHCFVVPETSKFVVFARIPTDFIISNGCIVIASDDWGLFAVLQSDLHAIWARRPGLSKLKIDPRYNAVRCFATFPFPEINGLRKIGQTLYSSRSEMMIRYSNGLTSFYNRFHDPSESSADFQNFRELHVEMDRAVALAYGWADLKLDHDFHETKVGVRFSLPESSKFEILKRLLKLNNERHAEEIKQGLHEKKVSGKAKSAGPKAKVKKADLGGGLFDL